MNLKKSFRVLSLCLLPLLSQCNNDNAASQQSSAAVVSDSSDSSNTQQDVVVTGTLAIGDTPAEVGGVTGIKLDQREVEVKNPAGSTVAKTQTGTDGSYTMVVPGALVLNSEDSSSGLALAGGSLRLESVVSDTADGSVIGNQTPLDFSKTTESGLALGATKLEKITAIRGAVKLEGAKDHTGIAVYIPGTSFAARSDSSGAFLMTFVGVGAYELRFEKDGYVPVGMAGVVVKDKETTKIEPLLLKLSGGTGSLSLTQVGKPGFSAGPLVTYKVEGGDVDRYKVGLESEIETLPYKPMSETISYKFPRDGSYELKFAFANADGFEVVLIRGIVIDGKSPDSTILRLVDPSSLSATHTNELKLLAYTEDCEDIVDVAVMTREGPPKDLDFQYACEDLPQKAVSFYQLESDAESLAYTLWARDGAGNVSAKGQAGSIVVDTQAPTAPAFTLVDSATSSAAITASSILQANVASCTGVDSILVGDNLIVKPEEDAGFIPCATSIDTLLANTSVGAHTLYLWAKDKSGNISKTSTQAGIIFDNRLPGIPAFYASDATSGSVQFSNDPTVKITVTSCANISKVLFGESLSTAPSPDQFSLPCSTAVNAFSYTIPSSGNGIKSLYMWSVSPAGVVSITPEIASITLQTTAPSVPTVSVFDGDSLSSTFTNERAVKATLSDCTNITAVMLSFTQSTQAAENQISANCSTATANYTVNIPTAETQGAKTLYVWLKDEAGNIAGGVAGSITLDETAPGVPSFTLKDQSSGSLLGTDITTVYGQMSSCEGISKILLSESQLTKPLASAFSQSCSTAANAISYTFGNNVAESKLVFLWALDAAGNVSSTSTNTSIILDRTAPTAPSFTLADPTPVSGQTFSNSLALNVAVANCTDITHVFVSETASSQPSEGAVGWQTCSTTATQVSATALGEGNRTFYLWARDIGGNISAVATQASLVINTNAPAFSLADPTPTTGGYSNSLTLTATPVHCNDITHIIVSETQASAPSLSSGSWVSCSTSGVSAQALGQGSRTLYLWAKYSGGYVSVAYSQASITVDTSAPTAPVFTLSDSSNSNATYSNAQGVTANVTCSDSIKVYLSETNSAPDLSSVTTDCSGSVSFNLANLNEGTKTVYLWGLDVAGNLSSSSSSDAIIMDTTPPSLPSSFSLADTTNSSTSYTNSTTVNYTLGSCPAGTQVLMSRTQSSQPFEWTSGWSSCQTSGSSAFLVASETSQTVYLWIMDEAGNVNQSSLSHAITYDVTPPTSPSITLADTGGGSTTGYTNDLGVNVSLGSCSGYDKILLSESASQPAEGSVTTTCATSSSWTFSGSDGTKRLYVWVKDFAGNVNSSTSFYDIIYDTSTPSISNIALTALGTDRLTMSWNTSESLYTRFYYDTASRASASDYVNLNVVSASTSSHSVAITSLPANTTQYYRLIANDFAEHNTASSEFSLKTMKFSSVTGTENNAKLGDSTSGPLSPVATCDINNDGKDDLIVGAPYADISGTDGGAVYVFLGTSNFDSTISTADASIIYTNEGAASSFYFGTGVKCLDFNGDGISDLMMSEKNDFSSGDIHIVYGGSSIATGTLAVNTPASINFDAGTTGAVRSKSSMSAGDINNDGKDEVMFCGYSLTSGNSSYRGCQIFSYATATTVAEKYVIRASTGGDVTGVQNAIADVDGDGYDDIIIGNSAIAGETNGGSNNGAVFIKKGGALPASSTEILLYNWSASTHPFDYEIHGGSNNMKLSNVFVGDIDGDGYNDMLIGSEWFPTNGGLYIVWGRPASGSAGLDWADDPYISVAATSLHFGEIAGTDNYSNYVSIRDVNADGKADLLLGDDDYSSSKGHACLFLGRSQASWAALADGNGNIAMTSANMCVVGKTAGDKLGRSVAMGNFDGTGTPELIVTIPEGDGINDASSNTGELGILWWSLPTNYSNLIFDVTPEF